MYSSAAKFAILAALVATAAATPATTLTRRYDDNCKGSTLCRFDDIHSDCAKAIASVDPGATYTDQHSFSVGHCHMVYATNGAGPQPVSGQVIIDTANTIHNTCKYSCGSYGTNSPAGCDKCHVTLNYRG